MEESQGDLGNASVVEFVDRLVERLRPAVEETWVDTNGSHDLLHEMLDELIDRTSADANARRGGDPAANAAASLVAHLIGRTISWPESSAAEDPRD